MSLKFTVAIYKEEDGYVSKCLENNVSSNGKTIEESMSNLSDAISIYYEDNISNISSAIFVTTMEVAI
ncbi:MAG TPA: type II toxin-antitoxin system HicB family antitoxin [Clostridiales bacterium]|nr:type II toxin-antitoxin system HicB family antitoxin [Clostridiales bacterium]